MSFREKSIQYILALFFVLYFVHKFNLQIQFAKNNPSALSPLDWASWALVMLTFAMFAFIYFVRGQAKVKSKGFWESVFPVFSIFLPLLVYESIYHISLFPFFLKPLFKIGNSSFFFKTGTLLIFLGNLLNIYALLYLKDAFSILVQARKVISQGPYHFVRHPLYLGEFCATLGFVFIIPSLFNILLLSLFGILQNERAKLEEKKLAETFPVYQEYLKNTGRYFPKIQAFK